MQVYNYIIVIATTNNNLINWKGTRHQNASTRIWWQR